MVDVVLSSLQFGLTSCKIAGAANGGVEESVCLKKATRALEIAEQYMWKLKLSHPDFGQLMAQAERLKFEIAILKDHMGG